MRRTITSYAILVLLIVRGYVGFIRGRENARSNRDVPFAFAEALFVGLWVGIDDRLERCSQPVRNEPTYRLAHAAQHSYSDHSPTNGSCRCKFRCGCRLRHQHLLCTELT